MRILHLVSYSLFSGPLPPTLGLAVAQRRLGHAVWLAHDSKRGAFNDYEEAAGPPVVAAAFDHHPVPLVLSTKSTPLELWRDWRCLRAWLGRGEIDLVHVHMSHDHLLATLAVGPGRRPPVVRTIHAERSLQPRFGQRWLNRRATAVVARCQEHRQRLLDRFGGSADQVVVIPGSIDIELFRPPSAAAREAARRRFGIPEAARLVGHVALIADRGQEELVRAASMLGDAAPHLLFVGRGEGEAALRQRVAELGMSSRVHFAGYLQSEQLLDAYAAMDLAFVAQPGNDASARAALEGMACARPLMAVCTGALAELVTPAVGYPIPVRSASAIAEALRQWVADDGAATQRGMAARQHVAQHRSFEREAQATQTVYERVLGD